MAIVGIGMTTLAPLVWLAMQIFVTPSVLLADLATVVVYALLFPIVGIATTLWYQQRQRPADVTDAQASIGAQVSSAIRLERGPAQPDR
jgi:hypothetical protein